MAGLYTHTIAYYIRHRLSKDKKVEVRLALLTLFAQSRLRSSANVARVGAF